MSEIYIYIIYIYTGCVVCTGPSQMAIDLSLRSDCSKRFERLQPPLVLKLRKYCVFFKFELRMYDIVQN